MNKAPKEKTKRIELRVTEKEKAKILKLAKSCGLSTSEYVKQRALGFEPKAVLPDVFYHFCEKVDELMEQNLGDEVNDRIIELMARLENELIKPRKEDIDEWR
ncbi:MAG: plasmid mobilization protein [Acutalibacteraceae bacterium]